MCKNVISYHSIVLEKLTKLFRGYFFGASGTCAVTVTVTICGDACPLSCDSAEA